MEKPTKEYLTELLNDSIKKFADFEPPFIDESQMEISYIATKERNHMGIMDGPEGMA